MIILKFGGSSVAKAERIQNVIAILQDTFKKNHQIAVVVSAFGGATDELIQIAIMASKGDKNYLERLKQLKIRHTDAVAALIPSQEQPTVIKTIDQEFHELENALHGVMLVQELSNRTLDLILSYGERLSAYIIAQSAKPYIPSTYYLDARNLIVTDKNYGSAKVNYEETNSRISKHFKENPGVPIITGFISSTLEGDTTTLGRGGSDFTASILGAALNAECIEIWTDVDGVLTADPRKVARAFSIPQMTYKEALEMSHFGAKVIHPPTISPALKKNIPLFIKNTFNPHFPGTLISNKQSEHENSICGISSIDAVSLLRLEGNGMIGVCGIAMRLFGALAKNEISVIMITQGSSEHSICLAISPQSAHSAQQAINTEFSLERHSGLIDNVILEEGHSIVAIVGENMRKTKGIAGKVFSSLGDNEINVVAIAQGSSEYNITIVIDQKDLSKTLNVIHDKFFL